MKKIGSFHKTLLAAFGAAAAWLAVSAVGAAELKNDPNLTRNADGVYEISASAPESVRFYSEPVDVVPGGLYRFGMKASWFGDGGGCFPAGIEGATTDYSPAEDETPKTPCERVIRIGDNCSQTRLCVGRWESKRTTRFTEPTLVPVAAIHKMVWEGEEGAPGEKSAAASGIFLPLGSGERIDGARYTFQAFADWNDGNTARTLDYTDTPSNTSRWCFGGGNSVVYRFDLRPISLDAARGAGEPLRFVSANVSVDSHFFVSGRCVVEISADGQNWQTVGTLEEKGVVTGTAEELFASPVETLFVRCRAEENASFQIHGLTLAAELDSDRFTGRGETIYAEVGGDADSADQNFEVTPLYFDKEELCCRVVNKADEARAWPLPAFSVVVDGGDEVPCPASVRRVGSEGADDGKMAAGESALYLVDLSNHPSGKEVIEKTCRFDKSYSFTQRVFPCFVQDYTYPLDGIGGLFGLSWCEADWRVPRAPWYVKMKKPQPIAIAAPRNDFESFQVVVRPTVDLANLTAESSDLAGPDGAVIPRENIQVRWGYYHFVDVPTDYTCARGWYVDAMVPITVGRSGEAGAPLSVAAGDNQPIFVTVYVPAGTPKGDYTGKLTIGVLTTGVGAQPRHVQVPFKLTVWDFDQPKKNRFETAYGFSPWEAFRYQNASTDQQRRSIWEKYLKNASDHRISFYDSTPLDGFGVTFDTENLKANFDFAAFDAEMARVMEKYNVTNFKVPVQGIGGGTFDGHTSGGLAGFSVDTPEFDKLMRDYLGQLQEHLRDKGWLDKGYVYWFDEPEPKDYGFVAGGFGHLKKYAPDLPRMLTEEPSDAFCDTLEEAGGNVDIWCPISNCYSSAEAQKRMAKGERFWWYVCTGPKAPYCTEFTDHPAHELRLWHWQAFQRGITGSLIWATNYWTSSAAFPDGAQDPYVDPMCYVVGYGTPPGTKAYWGNGDGRFFYPPLAAATPGRRDGKVIDEEPVNSIRWEELREGIEDYEMLLTLRERFEAKTSALSEDQRAEIEKLFDFSEITTDMTHFTGDPTVILLHRARVAEAIERLGE